VRAAIFGNVGTMVVFRVGAADAEYLEKEFAPEFEANDFVNIPNFHYYIKLMIEGVASHPFSACSLPPPPLPPESFVDEILEHSRRQYALPRAEVEKKIAESYFSAADRSQEVVRRRNERPLRDVLTKDHPKKKSSPHKGHAPKREVDITDMKESIRRALHGEDRQ
jgi:hypothetical protein